MLRREPSYHARRGDHAEKRASLPWWEEGYPCIVPGWVGRYNSLLYTPDSPAPWVHQHPSRSMVSSRQSMQRGSGKVTEHRAQEGRNPWVGEPLILPGIKSVSLPMVPRLETSALSGEKG